MTRFLLSAALMVSLAACSAEQASATGARADFCDVAEGTLAGDWQRTGEAGTFEQFSLGMENGERRFDSWLHERPEVSGGSWTYQVDDCRLALNGADSNLVWHFKVSADESGNRLTLSPLDAGSGTVDGTYQRLAD
ncbi:hypothetical protein TI01_1014 [Lysobacter sp. A03]|nr:hypothetical protein TI01_1014 [Lysobacter sp. A03]